MTKNRGFCYLKVWKTPLSQFRKVTKKCSKKAKKKTKIWV